MQWWSFCNGWGKVILNKNLSEILCVLRSFYVFTLFILCDCTMNNINNCLLKTWDWFTDWLREKDKSSDICQSFFLYEFFIIFCVHDFPLSRNSSLSFALFFLVISPKTARWVWCVIYYEYTVSAETVWILNDDIIGCELD